ncbi:protein Z-dependent protease inhibitor-like [Scomber japonicus]|uniref:protein Z-dependent protease inhibitor-like n=1 Tax=Scomber japonicus TaxID=13676 RepID=UPI0023066D81|nr:protein Z-dependent protease inhibitor-like [Scomber japonicus]XP_053193290.1 protein Z-dependent protease inhibitor-like [Scomber japonicus]
MILSVSLCVGVLVLVSPASCQTASGPVQDLVQRNVDFGARLYRAVAARSDGNVLLAPLTLSSALSALSGAATGSTAQQLLEGLNLNGLDPQTVPELFQSQRGLVRVLDLKQGVGVFPAQTFQVSSAYTDLVQKLGGVVQTLNYDPPQDAADTINRWAQLETADQVQDLVTNLDPQTQLLLGTAAAYQTRFQPAFNASVTLDERFFADKYHVVVAPMMMRTDKYFLAYDRSLKVGVLKLPMADGTAMLVVLPDEDVDVTAVEEDLTGEKIRSWIRQLKKTKLEVQMPRFRLESSYSLSDVLQTLGITQAFQDTADLSGMGAAKSPTLTQVVQKSVVSVDESGGASDDRVSTFSSLPPRLTINRPFLFIVYEPASGSVLLMGRVVDPTKK